ncbi:hypothetical protein [Sphingomonas edaphi]|uniref:RcnB family protein n=1 Tax=Sphingomonas edaphi TaxID=2315689 RepID=A0A418Q3U2_9SPHN|nr:hypothetical protein [Sphingomonas edaphi]RIX32578.1 hypothetical protein D3M59_06525 [Sphingomonas edaphi]
MTKWMLAAGAAALAIVSPALAEKGGHGGGKGHGGGQSAKAERGGGGGGQKVEPRGGERAMRAPQRTERQRLAQRDDRPAKAQRVERRDNDNRRTRLARAENDRGKDRRVEIRTDRPNRDIRILNRDDRRDRDVRLVSWDRDRIDGVRFVPRWNDKGLVRGFADGCPPGLAKKGNGCMPPGQAKKLVGTALPTALMGSMLNGPYRNWYRDNDDYLYRWDDDYIYRVRRDGGLIDAFFPYQNQDYYYYPVGMQYPDYYNYYNVPYQYQSYYPDGGDYLYRYGDGAIYQVNPSTGLISGIAALLTGDPFAVGQPLPSAYSVYNVPFGYRDRYYDTADNWYRYNDGYIYQVDPTTQLITAVINALV